MSKLRPYLENYVKAINELLAKHPDDKAIIQAAEQIWIPQDPRWLVFIECDRYNLRMPSSPQNTAGGDVYRPNEIPTSPPTTPPATPK